MKQHFCSVENTLLSFEGKCNWCGEKEESMTQETALKLALKAFEQIFESTPPYRDDGTCVINDKSVELSNKAIAAIKETLAQEQEPKPATVFDDMDDDIPDICCQQYDTCLKPCTPRGVHLAQRTWVGLEGEEIRNLWEEVTKPDRSTMTMVTSFARAIESKLKEFNK